MSFVPFPRFVLPTLSPLFWRKRTFRRQSTHSNEFASSRRAALRRPAKGFPALPHESTSVTGGGRCWDGRIALAIHSRETRSKESTGYPPCIFGRPQAYGPLVSV